MQKNGMDEPLPEFLTVYVLPGELYHNLRHQSLEQHHSDHQSGSLVIESREFYE